MYLLQVRPDNTSAVAIYRRRGFAKVDTVHELQLNRHTWPISLASPPAALRLPRASDHTAIRTLLARLGSVGGQPAATRRYTRYAWLWRVQRALRYALTAERTFEVVACVEPGVAAYAFAQAEAVRGPHELALFAAPEHRGRYESALLEWLLKRLQSEVPHNVRTLVSTGYPEALMAAWNLGFRTQRVLDQMVLDLEPGAPTEPETA